MKAAETPLTGNRRRRVREKTDKGFSHNLGQTVSWRPRAEGAKWALDRCEFKLGLGHALAVIRQFRLGLFCWRGAPVPWGPCEEQVSCIVLACSELPTKGSAQMQTSEGAALEAEGLCDAKERAPSAGEGPCSSGEEPSLLPGAPTSLPPGPGTQVYVAHLKPK